MFCLVTWGMSHLALTGVTRIRGRVTVVKTPSIFKTRTLPAPDWVWGEVDREDMEECGHFPSWF